MTVEWGKYQDAYKAIWEKLAEGLLWAGMIGDVITKVTKEYEGTGANKVLKRVKLWKGTAEVLRLRYDYDADSDNITIEKEAIP